MISGFNTDVNHAGCVYHVQTEDRGKQNPYLESLVYIGGTIVAKKSTPYSEQLKQGVSEDAIAALLKRQHQVIIAAIKAGRIEDLIRHSSKESKADKRDESQPASHAENAPQLPVVSHKDAAKPPSGSLRKSPHKSTAPLSSKAASGNETAGDSGHKAKGESPKAEPLNLDDVIAEYMRRSSEQGKLDLNVVSPTVFTAGKNINLRVKISYGTKPETEASVTIKIVGTAFKPQVYMGHAGHDGIASFNLNLPPFTAGTAAIVIEAQSLHGRGELKHLIRRA
jgi:hypothetical protein